MADRPGSAQARELFWCDRVDEWEGVYASYSVAVKAVSKHRKKPELIVQDQFLWSELPLLVNGRNPPYITRTELSQIMSWKLTRGKFRPLQNLVDGNGETAVINASTAAFRLMTTSDWKGATNALTILKGIGVATASAVLAALYPEQCPFMADEVIDVATAGTRDYTLKVYTEMRSNLIAKATTLGGDWTAEKVGKALWTKAMIYVHNISTADSSNSGNSSSNSVTSSSVAKSKSKRPLSVEAEEDCSGDEDGKRTAKKKVSRK